MSDETVDKIEIPVENNDEPVDQALVTIQPDELLEMVQEGARIYSELTEEFLNHFEFYGKSLKLWAREMTIKIEDIQDETDLRKVLVELTAKTQLAFNYYTLASSLSKAFGGGAELKKSDVVTAIVSDLQKKNQKRPAGAILERMADSFMKNTVSSRVAAAIVRDFWKQRLESLGEVRKLVEQLGLSLHMTRKYETD